MKTRGDKVFWGLVIGLLLLAAVLSFVRPELAQPETWQEFINPPVPEPVVAQREIGPAPTLQKGPTKTVKGRKIMSWITIDPQPGDATYAGTYVESGSHNGQPAYTNGSRWLVYYDGNWWMVPVLGDPPGAYSNDGPTLPGTWNEVIGGGAAPAPTLSEVPSGYAIVIDVPVNLQHMPHWNFVVVGRCLGLLDGIVHVTFTPTNASPVPDVPAAADWEVIYSSSGWTEKGAHMVAFQIVAGIVVAISNEVVVTWDWFPPTGGGTGGHRLNSGFNPYINTGIN